MAEVVTGASNGVQYKSGAPETEVASKLPEPSGYRILVALPEIEDTTQGGIYVPDERKLAEKVASITGYVLKMGKDCYQDKTRFPTGAWCKEGDWVIMSSYAGTRLKVNGMEFRIINDDSVQGTVADPRGIERV